MRKFLFFFLLFSPFFTISQKVDTPKLLSTPRLFSTRCLYLPTTPDDNVYYPDGFVAITDSTFKFYKAEDTTIAYKTDHPLIKQIDEDTYEIYNCILNGNLVSIGVRYNTKTQEVSSLRIYYIKDGKEVVIIIIINQIFTVVS